MLEQNILIGGEESGGIGTSLYLPERDATVSALLLAELMAWHGNRWENWLTPARGIRRTPLRTHRSGRDPPAKEKAIVLLFRWPVAAVARLAGGAAESLDGIKVYLGDIDG